jgi:DNA-binding MarR family transcriptional regulator
MGAGSLPPDVAEPLAGFLRGLSNPHRLRVLLALAEQPLRGHQVSQRCGVTPQEASRHLARLARMGLVQRGADRTHTPTDLGRALCRHLNDLLSVLDAAPAQAPPAAPPFAAAEPPPRP